MTSCYVVSTSFSSSSCAPCELGSGLLVELLLLSRKVMERVHFSVSSQAGRYTSAITRHWLRGSTTGNSKPQPKASIEKRWGKRMFPIGTKYVRS